MRSNHRRADSFGKTPDHAQAETQDFFTFFIRPYPQGSKTRPGAWHVFFFPGP